MAFQSIKLDFRRRRKNAGKGIGFITSEKVNVLGIMRDEYGFWLTDRYRRLTIATSWNGLERLSTLGN